MQWHMEIKRGGVVEETHSGQLQDPFWNLALESRGQPASVEAKVSHWGQHVSVAFKITIQCPQTKDHIEYASHLAYRTAVRYVNDAVSRLDSSMPLLPTE
jgi:hypothetical protein